MRKFSSENSIKEIALDDIWFPGNHQEVKKAGILQCGDNGYVAAVMQIIYVQSAGDNLHAFHLTL